MRGAAHNTRCVDGTWTARFIAATALLWIVLATIVGVASDASARAFEPIGARSLFASTVALGTIAGRPSVNARVIVAASLLLLAVEGQIAGFHGSRPSAWECVLLSAAALAVVVVRRDEHRDDEST